MTTYNSNCDMNTAAGSLKLDIMADWLAQVWIPAHPETDWLTVQIDETCLDLRVLNKFDYDTRFEDAYRFEAWQNIDETPFARIHQYTPRAVLYERAGVYQYRFTSVTDESHVDVAVLCSYYTDQGYQVSLACIPADFLPVWTAFTNYCSKLAYPEERVMVVGGTRRAFDTTVMWDEVVLPEALKTQLMQDFTSFFARGVPLYQRMNINPFRKLLLAGVPGTGKTMLCNALANYALEQAYQVIYVSSADKYGSQFWKIQHALDIATNSEKPALILLEELDAYLNDEANTKALILNVLDGAEAAVNERGTLLIATTNYPEAIDERVLKRPGRLDRIYIIPEVKDERIAERMLRRYLGDAWQPDHATMAAALVGYPGAFVREVVLAAMMQQVQADNESVPLIALEQSFEALREQIDARDDFLKERHAENNGQVV